MKMVDGSLRVRTRGLFYMHNNREHIEGNESFTHTEKIKK